MQDWNDLRWKHIDESLGLVNLNAQNTYDKIYYFYYNYYTYTANQNYWSDSLTYDEQQGGQCYSYTRSSAGSYSSNYSCKRVAEAYTVTYVQFRGMIVGLTFAAVALAVFTFGCCEIRAIKKRDNSLRVEIEQVTKQALERVVRTENSGYQDLNQSQAEMIPNQNFDVLPPAPVSQLPNYKPNDI